MPVSDWCFRLMQKAKHRPQLISPRTSLLTLLREYENLRIDTKAERSCRSVQHCGDRTESFLSCLVHLHKRDHSLNESIIRWLKSGEYIF